VAAVTWHRPPLRPRLEGDDLALLGTRQYAAEFAGRHVNQVRRHCVPVACDVRTRQPLYDLDVCVAQLATLRRVSLDRDQISGHPVPQ